MRRLEQASNLVFVPFVLFGLTLAMLGVAVFASSALLAMRLFGASMYILSFGVAVQGRWRLALVIASLATAFVVWG